MLIKETKIMRTYNYSPELSEQILNDITLSVERELANKIITRFVDAELKIQVKHIFYDKPYAYYRVLLFIKKSAEHVIINTKTVLNEKDGVIGGMTIQTRINNKSTLDNLAVLSENTRRQIIDDGDCGSCSEKCAGKQYTFSYQGQNFVKCYMLCGNFRFENLTDVDVSDIINIVDNELKKRQFPKISQPV